MVCDSPAPGYEIDDDPRRIDRDAVWAFMNQHAAWGRWRSRTIVDTQIDNSWRTVGVYESATGAMVGFARAVSDTVSVAYLADVYVLPSHRGRGLGLALVRAMVDGGPDFRWMLHTADAHGLYAQAGFAPPDRTYLERPGAGRSVTAAASAAEPVGQRSW
jgi:GNAT superfamily N-acetyltransferase